MEKSFLLMLTQYYNEQVKIIKLVFLKCIIFLYLLMSINDFTVANWVFQQCVNGAQKIILATVKSDIDLCKCKKHYGYTYLNANAIWYLLKEFLHKRKQKLHFTPFKYICAMKKSHYKWNNKKTHQISKNLNFNIKDEIWIMRISKARTLIFIRDLHHYLV